MYFSENFNKFCHGLLRLGALGQGWVGGHGLGYPGGGDGEFALRAEFFLTFSFSGSNGAEVWRLAILGSSSLGGDGSCPAGGLGGRGDVEDGLQPLCPRVRGCSSLGDPGEHCDGGRGLPGDPG